MPQVCSNHATFLLAYGVRKRPLSLLDDARGLLAPLGAVPALARIAALAHELQRAHAAPPSRAQTRYAQPHTNATTDSPDAGWPPVVRPDPALAELTGRQYEIVRLIGAGRTNQQIAALLSLSAKTVERHVTTILRKTRLGNRIAVAMLAQRVGLVTSGAGDMLA